VTKEGRWPLPKDPSRPLRVTWVALGRSIRRSRQVFLKGVVKANWTVARKEGSLQTEAKRQSLNWPRGQTHKTKSHVSQRWSMRWFILRWRRKDARRQLTEQLYDFYNHHWVKAPYVNFLRVAQEFSSRHYCSVLCKNVFWVLGQFGFPHICFIFSCMDGFSLLLKLSIRQTQT